MAARVASQAQDRFIPAADRASTVVAGKNRFTVLTPALIRLEWSESGRFEDRPSLVFINRKLPVPRFRQTIEGGWLTIETDSLKLRYKMHSGIFTTDNLSITLRIGDRNIVWKPGMKDTANLLGTTRTLDGVRGATELEPGLVSRDGWVLVDDTDRPLFDDSDWPWVVTRPDEERVDWYFFGYGYDYKKAMFDFTRVAGKIPMPPRFAFGLWWSRYWAYTDQEFKDLVLEFEDHRVPLDVLVIDMDWHKTFNLRWGKQPKDQAGQALGWTGYSWDTTYFPDPEGFLDWCKKRGLRTPLNLHPASGIQPHEDRYPEMARAMGVDPSTNIYVPFDIVDKIFAENYLDIILRPLEKQGVDFWWLDWQQWGTTKIRGVTPTWWLNYVHFTDMERQGNVRPILFHRWGGLGNHRYQIGFSGDAISVWESLAFQPYFTATAANVGYGYWSHDIGGHMPGVVGPELYTRWIQFGIFSPIVRTHTTKNPEAERRIWEYPAEYFLIMRDAIRLRYALIPYIYTAAREAYDSGVAICRPMYYDHPAERDAYTFRDQYYFGRDMIVAPVTEELSADSLLTTRTVWLPQGGWYEWSTGSRLEGPARLKRTFALDEIPMYLRCGAIIPMQEVKRTTSEGDLNPLILTIAPGDSGETRVYEDQGNSPGYQRDECAWTTVRQRTTAKGTVTVTIDPVEGRYPGMLKDRSYVIRLVGTFPPVEVRCNGETLEYEPDGEGVGWRYSGDEVTTVITLPSFRTSAMVEVVVTMRERAVTDRKLLNGVVGRLKRLRRAAHLINNRWPKEWSPDSLVHAAQTGNRMSINPDSVFVELRRFHRDHDPLIREITRLDIDTTLVRKIVKHLRLVQ